VNLDPTSALIFGAFMFCLAFLLAIVAAVLAIAKALKRSPPLDQELYKEYARKEDVTKLEGKMEGLNNSINLALRDLTSQISNLAGEIRARFNT
jgi:hypothetical protein